MILTNEKVIKSKKPIKFGYSEWTMPECEYIWGWNKYTLLKELPNKKFIWLHTAYAAGDGTDSWICTNSDKYVGRDYKEVLNEIDINYDKIGS